jgi:3-oxoacyl-[acyl-carrier protein] reductase
VTPNGTSRLNPRFDHEEDPMTTSTEPAQSPVPYVKGHALLEGRTVVVTAAAGAGIGASIARRCLEEDARAIVIGDIHQRRLDEATATLREEFGEKRVTSVLCDVTNEEQVEALLDAAEPFGGVDVLVNNAALGATVSVLDLTDEQWSRILDVTLTGTFRCIRNAARRMVAKGTKGVIVNNASILGWRALEGQAAYAAAKAGVMALTRDAAMDVAKYGIRINAVVPSLVLNPFLAKVTSEELLAEWEKAEAFGRSAKAWEVANVVIFLASDYASYMTGENVSVSCQHP